MCLICVDFQKSKMTIGDARRALGEMASTLPPEHVREVKRLIEEAERKQDDHQKGGTKP